MRLEEKLRRRAFALLRQIPREKRGKGWTLVSQINELANLTKDSFLDEFKRVSYREEIISLLEELEELLLKN